ncbi:hypothetical protein Pmani_012229 [Petrolisthes manimaculis]|uniref:Integrase catalytic domain-containing protein n=1 Tax=Petrolisthes manimaculis TaxID=1843537 RepID=A0AAE1PY74_9EUCA|nr:hypothetical protein Pmani_012229 [Petrolisthes manimaculis]
MEGDTAGSSRDNSWDMDDRINSLKKQRGVDKGKFTTKVRIFNNLVLQNNPTEVLDDIFCEICSLFERVENTNDEILQADKEDSQSEHLEYIGELQKEKCDVQCKLLNYKTNKKRQNGSENCNILIKKVEPPTFNGDVREFPTFVKDFTRLVISRHGKDPFILRQSLQGKAREAIGRLDDFDQMWDRLKERFGSSARVVEAVLGEICALKPVPEGNKVKLLHMINVVEQAWLDLKKLNKENEIANVHSLTRVEHLLPADLKREWTRKARDWEDDKKFEELVIFLTEERQVIEYMDDELRQGKSDTRGTVHLASGLESDNLCGLAQMISKLTENQESGQRHMLECLNSMAQTMMNVASQNQPYVKASARIPERKYVNKGCWYHGSPAHEINHCDTFKRLDVAAKMDSLRKVGACFICLEPSHISRYCEKRVPCNVNMGASAICGKMHHPILHSIFVRENPVVQGSSNFLNREGILLMLGTIKSKFHDLSVFFDSGSNLTMITHDAARRLGLKGTDVVMSLTKVGNVTEIIESKIYIVHLTDIKGKEWVVEAVGLDEITSEVSKVDMREMAAVLEIDICQIERPTGKIDMLIGADYSVLLPRVEKTIGDLQLMKSQFGYCVRGCLGQLKGGFHPIINHVRCTGVDNFIVKNRSDTHKAIELFFKTEELGVDCSPQCGGCRCGKCSLNGHLTLKEQREAKLIEEGLHYDDSNERWVAEYPWIRDPRELPNNYPVVFARLLSTEKRLSKLGISYSSQYSEQMQDMMDRGVARKLTEEEMLAYKGPVFYLPHHEVHKTDSRSTPLRIVFNSSASYMGFSLNEFLAKGPDCLNNIFGVLLRFRQGFVGLMGDVRKMYNSVQISLLDQHCHRFLWREMNTKLKPDQYVLTTVTFGDRPGGAIAMIALQKTAQMANDCPRATKLIESNSYVDDLITSVDDYSEAGVIMREVDTVLKRGGFKIKEWVISGGGELSSLYSSIVDIEDERVLGVNWNPLKDFFYFKVQLNFSRRVKNRLTKPNLMREEIETELPVRLTKRMLLRQVASIYDPLGLITPFTLRIKLLMRELVMNTDSEERLGWDDTVNFCTYNKWKSLFKEMFAIESLKFSRCIKPRNAVGNPELIIFADASTKAYGAVAYARWKQSDGTNSSSLIASKSKLAPTRQITVPRLELCAALLACRLRKFIEEEMEWSFDSIIHMTDSEIVRAQIQKDSFRFNTFVANRVNEIQVKSSPGEWFWVNSKLNISDWCTRECAPSALNERSAWQMGPEFLTKPKEEWPVCQSCSVGVTDELYTKRGENLLAVVNREYIVDISRFSDYNKLINVTARVMKVISKRSILRLCHEPEVEDLHLAEIFWIKTVQRDISEDWKVRYQRLGPKMNEEGIITVGHRINNWLKTNWNRNEYILLPPSHPFTKLLILHFHNRDHSGVEATLVKLQGKFWVPGVRRLIKSVKSRCVMCRRIEKVCETQCMSVLPEERISPTPPFYNTSLDLFGPFYVIDTVKKRTRMKVFGVIFTCMWCRAVYLDLAEGYDTGNFLRAFRRFTSVRGFPRIMYSDRGCQLVKANKELSEAGKKLNFSELSKFGNTRGMTWKFTKSADAPWQNGCSESLIRLVKRAMNMSIGEKILQYGELQTVLFEIANLINERPIGIKPGSDINLGSYLSPNDLLLGRTNNSAPTGYMDGNSSFSKGFKYANEIVNAFWKKWMRDFFPTLAIRAKWHTERRNVRPNDIVLVKDSNAVRGSWKLAQVVTATPGTDGKVRNVTLRYKAGQSGSEYNGQRDILIDRSVHNIVVIIPVEEQ